MPRRLLVIGGGIIGLEMATVYSEFGARITVVELMDQLIPGADSDIVAPLAKRIRARYENVYLKTKVTGAEAGDDGLRVSFEGPDAPASDVFDGVLVAVGRIPNGRLIGAEQAGVHVDDRGYIPVDKQQRTNVPHSFAIGDIVGQPMLAHKATHEGRVAAQVAAGQGSHFDAKVIPSVAYTDPEVAWAGVTMLDRGYGRIINISSVVGSAGGFGQANYAAAKSGMFGLTMSLALETASKGITVNSVTPGYITTDMTAAVPAAAMEKIIARIPVGRLGEPNEVARVVEFLADPESGYITGQVYPVNGGLYM